MSNFYKSNREKIILDYGSAVKMCESLGISYNTYQFLLRKNSKKLYFRTQKAKEDFFKLLNNGYILEVNPDEVQNV